MSFIPRSIVSRSDLGVDLEVIDDLKARAEPLDARAARVGCGSVGMAAGCGMQGQFHSIPVSLSCWWKASCNVGQF